MGLHLWLFFELLFFGRMISLVYLKKLHISFLNLCSAIYDVNLTDDSWSTEIFDFVAGNTSNSWEKLDA